MAQAEGKNPTRLLAGAIMLFEAGALLLIAVKPVLLAAEASIQRQGEASLLEILEALLRSFNSLHYEALALAFLLPFLCWLSTRLLPKLFPIDQLLMALTNFLCGAGIVSLYSMVPEIGMRQALFFALGVPMMVVSILAVLWIQDWKRMCWLMMPASIALLALPVVAGQWSDGARNGLALRWFGNFQPSEVVKLMLILALAHFFSTRRGRPKMLPALLFVAPCLGMLMLQRDLGTALLYYMTALAMYFVSSSNALMAVLGMGGGAVAAVAGYFMFGHVRVRVAIWRNPWADALDKGYQIIQALMAIGSGGLFGLGLGLGLPRTIPAYHTDFIFAVICEQFGIVFGLCVILVYIVLLLRGFSIALRARQSFYAMLAFGCTVLLGIQTFVIIAGVIKMIPLTGITMPLLSYGGTSLLSCMVLLGLLQGVNARINAETEQDFAIAEASEWDAEEGEPA